MSNPIFPASRAELKAFHPVLEIACVDAKSEYDEVKSRRQHPQIADTAGAAYRAVVAETYVALRSGECKGLFEDLVYCNGRYEYDYARNCKTVRDSLQECVVKNKLGELGK